VEWTDYFGSPLRCWSSIRVTTTGFIHAHSCSFMLIHTHAHSCCLRPVARIGEKALDSPSGYFWRHRRLDSTPRQDLVLRGSRHSSIGGRQWRAVACWQPFKCHSHRFLCPTTVCSRPVAFVVGVQTRRRSSHTKSTCPAYLSACPFALSTAALNVFTETPLPQPSSSTHTAPRLLLDSQFTARSKKSLL